MGLGIKTFLKYKFGEFAGKHPEKFEGHYAVWRAKRIQAILDNYGHRFFENKKILELGAGYGAIGAFFSILGADVLCLEGRESNVRVIQKRYPFLKALKFDLAEGIPPGGAGKYNVIIHMGVLYHLPHPEKSLREACRKCDDLILETEVADSDDPNLIINAHEKSYVYDQALDGVGCRPSPAYVERILKEENMSFTRIEDGRCNWEFHSYDWPITNSKQSRSGQRRMWFAKKTSQ